MGTGLAAFLASLVGPLVKRGLVALGFSFVTYVGVDAALNAALANAKTSLAGLPADALAIIAMSGLTTALGITTGALVARLSLLQLKRLIPR